MDGILDHTFQDNEYKSGLISVVGHVGLREDDGWLDAEDYTPKYSAVIKLAQLMVTREVIERYQNQGLNVTDGKQA